jgi:hypothetical protein
MTEEQYWAAIKALGLSKYHLGNRTYVDRVKDHHFVQDPAQLSYEARREFIEELKSLVAP